MPAERSVCQPEAYKVTTGPPIVGFVPSTGTNPTIDPRTGRSRLLQCRGSFYRAATRPRGSQIRSRGDPHREVHRALAGQPPGQAHRQRRPGVRGGRLGPRLDDRRRRALHAIDRLDHVARALALDPEGRHAHHRPRRGQLDRLTVAQQRPHGGSLAARAREQRLGAAAPARGRPHGPVPDDRVAAERVRRPCVDAVAGAPAGHAQDVERPGERAQHRTGAADAERGAQQAQRPHGALAGRPGGGEPDPAVAVAGDDPERRRHAGPERRRHLLAAVVEAREVDPSVWVGAVRDRCDRRVVARRRHRQAADRGIEGVQRRRFHAVARRKPGGDGARGVGGDARGREQRLLRRLRLRLEVVEQAGGHALLGQLALVQLEALLEQVLGPRRLRGRGREPPAGRDRDQRLLGERELLHLVPAAEAEARVPVQIAAVRPVTGQHARHPAPQQRLVGDRQRPHAARDRGVVEAHHRRDDVRVLGRIDVELRALEPVRQIVELHPRPERAGRVARGSPDAAHERRQLAAQVALEPHRVAGRLRRGVVDLGVPVDLVQPQRRVAPVRAVGHSPQPVLHQRPDGGIEPQRVARPPRHRERVGDLAVDHQVLRAPRLAHRRHPAGLVRLAAGGRIRHRVHPRRSVHELGRDAAGARVLPRRALVPVQRRRRVQQQQVGVHHGVDRAGAGAVAVEPRAPRVVEPPGELVGEVPVARLVPGERGRGQPEQHHAGHETGEGRAHQRSQVRMIAFVKPRP